MLTPQDIQEISFEKALFGGYDMDSVDEILEPLTEDYITLYKENSVLKSKMRILVEKLEEYRKSEASVQNALMAAQKTCDGMVAETEKKCADMLREAESTLAAKNDNAGQKANEELARLEQAKAATSQFLGDVEKRLKRQLELIAEFRAQDDLKEESKPVAYDYESEATVYQTAEEKADALIAEIGQNVEVAVGKSMEVDEPTRRIETVKPTENVRKFEDLQFGSRYDPMGGNK